MLTLMLDSGAFSAWRKSDPVDLDAYCEFILANRDVITHCVALDVIIPEDPEAAARQSFENYLTMRRRGINPIPVFHAREPLVWLDRMLDAGAPYIGLAASSLVEDNTVDAWYQVVWEYLATAKGDPCVRGHCLGEGRFASVKRFPWFSADSTNWTYRAGAAGDARLGDGRFISMRNDGHHSRSSGHISRSSVAELAQLKAYTTSIGINPSVWETNDPTELRGVRFYMQAMFYLGFQRELKETPIPKISRNGLFKATPKLSSVSFEHTQFYLVASGDTALWPALAFSRYPNILCSYYYFKNERMWNRLRDFVRDPIKTVREYPPWASFLPLYSQTLQES